MKIPDMKFNDKNVDMDFCTLVAKEIEKMSFTGEEFTPLTLVRRVFSAADKLTRESDGEES